MQGVAVNVDRGSYDIVASLSTQFITSEYCLNPGNGYRMWSIINSKCQLEHPLNRFSQSVSLQTKVTPTIYKYLCFQY
jgi:hypothetical protein